MSAADPNILAISTGADTGYKPGYFYTDPEDPENVIFQETTSAQAARLVTQTGKPTTGRYGQMGTEFESRAARYEARQAGGLDPSPETPSGSIGGNKYAVQYGGQTYTLTLTDEQLADVEAGLILPQIQAKVLTMNRPEPVTKLVGVLVETPAGKRMRTQATTLGIMEQAQENLEYGYIDPIPGVKIGYDADLAIRKGEAEVTIDTAYLTANRDVGIWKIEDINVEQTFLGQQLADERTKAQLAEEAIIIEEYGPSNRFFEEEAKWFDYEFDVGLLSEALKPFEALSLDEVLEKIEYGFAEAPAKLQAAYDIGINTLPDLSDFKLDIDIRQITEEALFARESRRAEIGQASFLAEDFVGLYPGGPGMGSVREEGLQAKKDAAESLDAWVTSAIYEPIDKWEQGELFGFQTPVQETLTRIPEGGYKSGQFEALVRIKEAPGAFASMALGGIPEITSLALYPDEKLEALPGAIFGTKVIRDMEGTQITGDPGPQVKGFAPSAGVRVTPSMLDDVQLPEVQWVEEREGDILDTLGQAYRSDPIGFGYDLVGSALFTASTGGASVAAGPVKTAQVLSKMTTGGRIVYTTRRTVFGGTAKLLPWMVQPGEEILTLSLATGAPVVLGRPLTRKPDWEEEVVYQFGKGYKKLRGAMDELPTKIETEWNRSKLQRELKGQGIDQQLLDYAYITKTETSDRLEREQTFQTDNIAFSEEYELKKEELSFLQNEIETMDDLSASDLADIDLERTRIEAELRTYEIESEIRQLNEWDRFELRLEGEQEREQYRMEAESEAQQKTESQDLDRAFEDFDSDLEGYDVEFYRGVETEAETEAFEADFEFEYEFEYEQEIDQEIEIEYEFEQEVDQEVEVETETEIEYLDIDRKKDEELAEKQFRDLFAEPKGWAKELKFEVGDIDEGWSSIQKDLDKEIKKYEGAF